jgi:hypothetical protein
VPAQYITEAYVEAHLGTDYVNAVQAVDGVDLEVLIEAATGIIQGALVGAGYTAGDTTTDERVKAATLGYVRVSLATVPDATLPLPEGWNDDPLNPIAVFNAIVDGRLPIPGHALSTAGAVGGWQSTPRTGTYGRPPRASRTELKNY